MDEVRTPGGTSESSGPVELKKVLIISPKFPPINAADMHRVRQSLPYMKEFGWDSVTVMVDPEYLEEERDSLLEATIPEDLKIIKIPALDYRWTRKLGIGSIALRSMRAYWKAGCELIESDHYDLVFFSTTMFPIQILGYYWKRKYGIPYIVDMQDPWFSHPKGKKFGITAKFLFWYPINWYCEAKTMGAVDGLLSVSENYNEVLRDRYPGIREDMCITIPFGGAKIDFDILKTQQLSNPFFSASDEHVNVVYVGRGGNDMHRAARAIFSALKKGIERQPELFKNVRVHFVGTHYAPGDLGIKTLEPVAKEYGLENQVFESPRRVSYFLALHLLEEADMVILPGSEAPAYTASKLYPYILSNRPLLAIFRAESSVVDIIRKTRCGEVVTFESGSSDSTAGADELGSQVLQAWTTILERLPFRPNTDWEAFEPFTAKEMTRRQIEFFEFTLAQIKPGRNGRAAQSIS